MDRNLDITPLTTCALWNGSVEHTALRFGWLTEELLQDRMDRLERAPDLTPHERKYLAALRQVLDGGPTNHF